MSEPIEIQVAAWVRVRRTQLGLTREHVSEASGYSLSVIERIESGEGGSRLAAVGAVVEALGGRLEVTE